MELVLLIIAFWLVLLGAYAIWPALRWSALAALFQRPEVLLSDVDLTNRFNQQVAAAGDALTRPVLVRPTIISQEPRPLVHGLSIEVDRLRAEVQYLRSELEAAASLPQLPAGQVALPKARNRTAGERPVRPRRYPTGSYTSLPRPLRHLVYVVRSGRRLSIQP